MNRPREAWDTRLRPRSRPNKYGPLRSLWFFLLIILLVVLALWVIDGINKVAVLNKEKASFLEKKKRLENEINVLDRRIKLFNDPVWLDFYLRKNYSFLYKDEKLIIIKKDGGS
ncbi:hypothetical protein [Thermodesulfobium sp.]|uniref:Septum formation initiator family protein n=1 Tax=Thermodesulfobium narugense TaxID=184064 RepID=A0A7C5PRI5_9BACT